MARKNSHSQVRCVGGSPIACTSPCHSPGDQTLAREGTRRQRDHQAGGDVLEHEYQQGQGQHDEEQRKAARDERDKGRDLAQGHLQCRDGVVHSQATRCSGRAGTGVPDPGCQLMP
jgi:hypothetical protein